MSVTYTFINGTIADADEVNQNFTDVDLGTLPVVDTTSIVKGSVDATKLIRLEVDGLTTATTRVLTVQDKDITIADNADIPTVSDVAYNATSWDSNTDATTKNAIRDKIETMDTAIGLNTAKNTNVSTTLSLGTINATTLSITSDGGADDVTLGEADTNNAGLLGADKWDEIVANTNKDTNVSTDLSAGTRAPTTINVNSSDGTNATLVEADTTNAGILGSDKWDEIVANTTHSDGDGSDHADVATNTAASHTQNTDTALGSGAVAADHGTAATDEIVNVSYGTGDPPAANTTTIGSLFVKYTA